MAIVVGAGIAATGSIAGAAINSSSAGDAASAQEQASQNANSTQLSMYNQSRSDQAPWRAEGGSAVSALGQFYGLGGTNSAGQPTGSTGQPDYNKLLAGLPGYQFQMQQGTQAVDRGLSANGLLNSGAAGKDLQQFGQGLASNYANQYVNGLQSIAGLGQSSTQSTGVLGANAANQIGSNQIYAGNAAASGYANQANSLTQGLGGLVGAYGQYANAPTYNGPTTGYAASGGSDAGFNDYLNSIYQP